MDRLSDEARLVATFRQEIQFLRSVPMLTHLGDVELGRLCQVATFHRYASGTIILREGQINDTLYMVRGGRVRLLRRSHGGEAFLELGRGRFFGQVSMFDPAPSSATVVAATDLELMCLRERPLCDLLIAHPDVGVRLLAALVHDLARRHRTILKRMVALAPEVVDTERANL